LSVVFFVLIFATVALAQAPPGAQKPLGKNQIIDLVKAGMDSEELAKTVQERGIDFDLSDDYLEALRKAGAQDVLIKALRALKPRPLTKEQVLQLVVGGVASQRAAVLVKQRGIDFMPDEEYLETMRVAGAEEVLLAALRTAGEAATVELVVETSPNAEVYLDGELKGRANAQGELAVKSKLGAHTLKVSLARKKDFEKRVTLAGGQGAKIEARLEDSGPVPGDVKVNPKDGLKYVWIPSGTFQMGCSPGDSECDGSEKPAHQVRITKGFWIGQTEVTVEAFSRFVNQTGRQMPPPPEFNPGWSTRSTPIVNVSWEDANVYCEWAGGRLPTEAEWEYAARGGSPGARYGPLDDIAWYADNSGQQRLDSARIWREDEKNYGKRLVENSNRTRGVGQKRANGFGLFDMLGNVLEWVRDWYGADYYQNSPPSDPQGPVGGELRVLRGGSCSYYPRGVRVSNRLGYRPDGRNDVIGCRCLWEVVNP